VEEYKRVVESENKTIYGRWIRCMERERERYGVILKIFLEYVI